ncbi:MAG: hypothetical protein ACI92O_000276 [Colwellia sp.]
MPKTPIRSTTHHHSDQTIWLLNLDTGAEEKFSFTTFNVDVRKDHKILIAYNKQNKLIERFVNLSMDEAYYGDGIFNMCSPSSNKLATDGSRGFSLLVNTVLMSIPGISLLNVFRLASFADASTSVISYKPLPNSPAKKIAKNLIVASLLLNAIAYMMIGAFIVVWVSFITMTAIFSYKYLSKVAEAEYQLVKSHSNRLDELIEKYKKDSAEQLIA